MPAACRHGARARDGRRPAVRAPQRDVAFLRFDGTDELIEREGVEAAADALEELVTDVQQAVDHYEVCFLESDVDDGGGKLLLTAGAPRIIGDDEERMLLALRQVLEGDRRLPVRIGVNRGQRVRR